MGAYHLPMMTLACLVLGWMATGQQAPVDAPQVGPDPAVAAQEEAARQEMTDARAEESAVLDRREVIASRVGALVAALEKGFVFGGELQSAEDCAALFAEDARALLKDDAQALSDRTASSFMVGGPGHPLAFERFGMGESSGSVGGWSIDDATGPEDAIDDLMLARQSVVRALGGPPSRATEVRVKGVSPVADEDGAFDVRLLLRHLRAPENSAAISITSVLRLRVMEEGDDLKIVLSDQRVDSRVQAAGPAETDGFVDVAGAVLTDSRAALLRPSISALRDLLDSGLGVGVLGHHGVAISDLDGNGIEDIYLPQPGGIPNQLWLRQADGTAQEVAGQMGLDFVDATTSAIFVDLDGDGDRDACMGFDGTLRVFLRDGDVYRQAASFNRGAITGLAAADVNGDGLVDVYACAYANPYNGTAFPVPYHDAANGQENTLLLNVTKEVNRLAFVDATVGSGLNVGAARFSFAATFEDYDGDGDMDLYVANDFGRNGLYLNSGVGQFTERAEDLGAMDIGAGMAASFADLDGDGPVDLYVANMASSAGRRVTGQEAFQARAASEERALFRRHAKGNTLLLGGKDGKFKESPLASDGRWAWGAIPIDLDGNGALDLFVPNGFITGSKGKAPDL